MSTASMMVCEAGFGGVWGICMECPPGMYSTGGIDAVCTAVPKGFYTPLYGSNTFDLPCESAILPGAAICFAPGGDCKSGEFLEEGKCVKIPTGFFNPIPATNVYYNCMGSPNSAECSDRKHMAEAAVLAGKPWYVHRYLMNEVAGTASVNTLVDYQADGMNPMVEDARDGKLYNAAVQGSGGIVFSGGYAQLPSKMFYQLYLQYGSFSLEFFVDTSACSYTNTNSGSIPNACVNADGVKLIQIGQWPLTGKPPASTPKASSFGISRFEGYFTAFLWADAKPKVSGKKGNTLVKFDGAVTQVVLTVAQGGAVDIFVDGTNAYNGKNKFSITTFPADTYNFIGSNNFQGKINEFNVYAGALSASDILKKRNAGFLKFTSSPTSKPTANPTAKPTA